MNKAFIYFSILGCVSFSTLASTQTNQLVALGNNQFTDSQGFVDTFTCPAGGEPLVIYSTAANNKTPIVSRDIMVPAYVAPNFKATALTIPQIQQTDIQSNKYLTVKTRTPSRMFIQFGLNRFDQQKFYVNSVQFPVPYLKDEQQANKKKFVSQEFVELDNKAGAQEKSLPSRDHSFEQDARLDVMANVKLLTGYFTSWSQAGQWGGASNQQFTSIPYIFSSLPSEDDPNFFNGFGVWVCGNAE
ncbi:hypothetical protein SOPP22_05985 [Shewanella sp. OPT22]|nr:hypothetical protein SOPP22_05985 [Shewanella sp. OPT22]